MVEFGYLLGEQCLSPLSFQEVVLLAKRGHRLLFLFHVRAKVLDLGAEPGRNLLGRLQLSFQPRDNVVMGERLRATRSDLRLLGGESDLARSRAAAGLATSGSQQSVT